MNVGQEIFNQLKTLGFNDLMCWGATSFKSFNDSQFKDNHCGGLLFKVNGLRHKGHVMITLSASDLYNVKIGRLSKGEFVQKGDTLTGVYFDQLVETIDNLVEGYYEKGKSVYNDVNLFKRV